MTTTLESQELTATTGTRRPPGVDRADPVVQYTINNQGHILNAHVETCDREVAQRIAQFIEEHNRAARERSQVLK